MKSKTSVTAILIIALAVCCFFWAKSCKSDAQMRELKLKYETYRELTEADHELSLQTIDGLTNSITYMTKKIGGLQGEAEKDKNTITLLSKKLSDIVGQEPSQPELEKEPLVINLRAQVSKLTEMFTLSQVVVKNQEEQLLAWEQKYNLQVSISEEWKAMYEREHALRLASENLAGQLYTSTKRAKFFNKAAVVAVAGAVAYGLLK